MMAAQQLTKKQAYAQLAKMGTTHQWTLNMIIREVIG